MTKFRERRWRLKKNGAATNEGNVSFAPMHKIISTSNILTKHVEFFTNMQLHMGEESVIKRFKTHKPKNIGRKIQIDFVHMHECTKRVIYVSRGSWNVSILNNACVPIQKENLETLFIRCHSAICICSVRHSKQEKPPGHEKNVSAFPYLHNVSTSSGTTSVGRNLPENPISSSRIERRGDKISQTTGFKCTDLSHYSQVSLSVRQIWACSPSNPPCFTWQLEHLGTKRSTTEKNSIRSGRAYKEMLPPS
jgi:hypothetical protein